MTKRELQAVLDRSGATLYRLCKDLGLALSTASRWRDEVPGYAEWYARSLVEMTDEQVRRVRERNGRPRKDG